ncbi:MAG: SAM-dependent chlorinase/fluorinase [Bacteroidota bacterium]
MSVITFMSDFGTTDHYVAAVKATIVRENPTQTIVDLTHNIRSYDIGHAAHVLKHVYHEFPLGTVHLIAVDSVKEKSKAIATELEGHFFVGFDAGLLSLISDQKPALVIDLLANGSVFPAKGVLARAAVKLAGGVQLDSLGESFENYLELYPRQLKVTKREISGNVVAIDHYGNLITNIQKSDFEKIRELNGTDKIFTVRFGREAFTKIHQYYTEVESGDCFIMFSSLGYLEIGINKGDASALLGLRVDAPVAIDFT